MKPVNNPADLPEYLLAFLVVTVFLAALLIPKHQETPETRDILLTVPQKSSVNAQVTSGNNTINITDL